MPEPRRRVDAGRLARNTPSRTRRPFRCAATRRISWICI